MRVFFRVDSGPEVGSGHVARCSVLASALTLEGFEVHFICSSIADLDRKRLERRGFAIHLIRKSISEFEDSTRTRRELLEAGGGDLLVVDSYRLGSAWESNLRSSVQRILVIDDLHNRSHDCDFLLDAGLTDSLENPYLNLCPARTKFWLGLEYLMIPQGRSRIARGPAALGRRRYLVFLGGMVPDEALRHAIDGVLLIAAKGDRITVLDGEVGRHTMVDEFRANEYVTFAKHVDDPYSLYRASDVCIGSAGVSAWERVRAVLPSVVAVGSTNQMSSAKRLEENGAAKVIGELTAVSARDWAIGLESVLETSEFTSIQEACISLDQRVGSLLPNLVRELAG